MKLITAATIFSIGFVLLCYFGYKKLYPSIPDINSHAGKKTLERIASPENEKRELPRQEGRAVAHELGRETSEQRKGMPGPIDLAYTTTLSEEELAKYLSSFSPEALDRFIAELETQLPTEEEKQRLRRKVERLHREIRELERERGPALREARESSERARVDWVKTANRSVNFAIQREESYAKEKASVERKIEEYEVSLNNASDADPLRIHYEESLSDYRQKAKDLDATFAKFDALHRESISISLEAIENEKTTLASLNHNVPDQYADYFKPIYTTEYESIILAEAKRLGLR
jgi:plasmid stabilization system protein ParE